MQREGTNARHKSAYSGSDVGFRPLVCVGTLVPLSDYCNELKVSAGMSGSVWFGLGGGLRLKSFIYARIPKSVPGLFSPAVPVGVFERN